MKPNIVADTGNTCFLTRSDKHLCVHIIYFSLPHIRRKLWGKPQGSIRQGQLGYRCIPGREKVSKATSDLSLSLIRSSRLLASGAAAPELD